MKKIILFIIIAGLTLLPATLMASDYVSGGYWTHGVNSSVVYSYYDHEKKEHGSSVINYAGAYEKDHNVKAGTQSQASLPSGRGADYAYYQVS